MVDTIHCQKINNSDIIIFWRVEYFIPGYAANYLSAVANCGSYTMQF